ncbi:MAG TPA: hypothetical protein VFF06_36085, partial [Polyangia bacterium]|nr:hypothetical protein [Polyangia bacterium]
PGTLAIGPLTATAMPRDLVVTVLNGSELLEMARVRDVSIQNGQQLTYTAEVRKPLIFVGATLPIEPGGSKVLSATEILDGNIDLVHPPAASLQKPVAIPNDVAAGSVTSDGRFFIAGRPNGLSVFDTGRAVMVGDVALPFQPTRVATSARDVAVAALGARGADGAVAIITDVAGLGDAPANVAVAGMGTLRAQLPRAAAFAPDGQKLYVLTGGTDVLDPCDVSPPAANTVLTVGLDGQVQTTWTLPSFGADLAVDPTSGNVIVALPSANKVAVIDAIAGNGAVEPMTLFPVTCPATIAVSNGQVLAVSGGQDPVFGAGSFDIARFPLAGGSGPPSTVAVSTSVFEQPDGNPGPNFNQVIRLLPHSLAGYELALTPDGNRAVFGSRTHFLVTGGDLGFGGCKITFDVVEYGRYDVDLRSGAAAYELRSQLKNGTCETHCDDGFFPPTTVQCQMLQSGDRVAGIAAVFGGP